MGENNLNICNTLQKDGRCNGESSCCSENRRSLLSMPLAATTPTPYRQPEYPQSKPLTLRVKPGNWLRSVKLPPRHLRPNWPRSAAYPHGAPPTRLSTCQASD